MTQIARARIPRLAAASALFALAAPGLVLAPMQAAVGADPPASFDGGGLSVVTTSDTLNCYVEVEGDRSPEFFGGTACGTFVAYGGIICGPESIPAGGNLRQVPFTSMPCWGEAPSVAPRQSQLRHCVSLGSTGILLEQVDGWTPGGTRIDTSLSLTAIRGIAGPAGNVVVYRAGDCYVADDDFGTGSLNEARRSVSCISEATGRVQQWRDTTAGADLPHATMAEGVYSAMWSWINLGLAFTGGFDAQRHDNAAGLSWSFSALGLGLDSSFTLTSSMLFTPEDFALDTDADGLPDSWETSCYDANSDGQCQATDDDVMLALMGADPNVRDIFLEIDWMFEPARGVRGAINFQPSATALDLTQGAFWAYQGDVGDPCASLPSGCQINLHIDAGLDSVMDFASGRTWRDLLNGGGPDLSDGDRVAYSPDEVVPTSGGGLDWSGFDQAYRNDPDPAFDPNRARVFRYAVAVEAPHGSSSGLARVDDTGRPQGALPAFASGGQYFLFQGDLPGPQALAGTIVHELGHTLGLGHGGTDHVNFKPNYLSVMSYSFQFSGLFPSNRIDYSNARLASLQESVLSESNGIGLVMGAADGTRFHCPAGNEEDWQPGFSFAPAPAAIDWNCDGRLDSLFVTVDVNDDGGFDNLVGFDDWDHLVFRGGSIGALGLAAEEPPAVTQESDDELSEEEALRRNVLGNPGQGRVTAVGPHMFIAGEPGQEFYLRVSNLSWSPGSWTVVADGDLLAEPLETVVDIEGSSATELATATLALPIVADPQEGDHQIELELIGAAHAERLTADVTVAALTRDERDVLLKEAQDGELGVDPVVVEQLIRILTPDGERPEGQPSASDAGSSADRPSQSASSAVDGDGPTKGGAGPRGLDWTGSSPALALAGAGALLLVAVGLVALWRRRAAAGRR